MKLPIRIKFIGILIIASVLPLGIALVVAETLGHHYYWRSQGTLYMARAQSLSNQLGMTLSDEAGKIDQWVSFGQIFPRMQPAAPDRDPVQIDKAWPSLTQEDPLVHTVLNNPLSEGMRQFQKLNPAYVEILLSDTNGLLVASTGKSSDYIQSDESWWQQGMRAGPHQVVVEGIAFDESAGVFSLSLSVPVRASNQPEAPPTGVLKAVLDVSPLFSAPKSTGFRDEASRQVVLEDGSILADLGNPSFPPIKHHLSEQAMEKIRSRPAGFLRTQAQDEGARVLLGFAPLIIPSTPGGRVQMSGLTPMYVVVYYPADRILQPVQQNFLLIGAVGSGLIVAFGLAGYYIATAKILSPMRRIQAVARRIAQETNAEAEESPARRLPELSLLRSIKTGDEIEYFARDFETMAAKVLTYHERLEQEIAEKTAELERDLRMAREFQEALMPRSYPAVPGVGERDTITLHFEHIYRPASSVGGDFFDVLKLSEHRAGIFIADVMGHGARSALVTAILRALLQNITPAGNDPAHFLADLNRHFHEIVRSSGEVIFVSAFYLVIDTETAMASFASAGHPSPLIANRTSQTVQTLQGIRDSGPALGLFATSSYHTRTLRIQKGDLFLLFTDGVHESYNTEQEEFGLDRLHDTVAKCLREQVSGIASYVARAVHDFIAPENPADDLCLISVEVMGPSAVRHEGIAEHKSARPGSED